MSWWNPVSWLQNLFPSSGGSSSGDAGFMVRGGRELRWAASAFPISVTCARDLDYGWDGPLNAAMAKFKEAIGRDLAFLGPADAIDSLAAIWAGPARRRGLTRCIHVQGRDDEGVTDMHGFSDIDYDERSGEIRSVLVTVPVKPPPWATEMMLHELGHAMGLEHDQPGTSIMAAVLKPGSGQKLTAEDSARLRRAYGPAPF